jgi:hypothetical protein
LIPLLTALIGLLATLLSGVPAHPATAEAAEGNSATVYYYTPTRNWTSYHLHWAPTSGTWTTAPGTRMAAA